MQKYRERIKNKLNGEKGITLMSLVVTIIVLLILATISISAITNHGMIGETKNAKEEAEINSEYKVIGTAINQAKNMNKYGNLEKENIEKALDSNTGEGKTGVEYYDKYKVYSIEFLRSERLYSADTNGNVKYLGKKSEALMILADPSGGVNPKKEYGVNINIQTFVPININKIQYEWTKSGEDPQNYTDLEEIKDDETGLSKTATTTISTENSEDGEDDLNNQVLVEGGEYYLNIQVQTENGKTIEERFGPYVIDSDADNLNLKYAIIFKKNVEDESKVTGKMQKMYMKYGETKELNENRFSRNGYVFDGWNTKADGTGTDYEDKEEVTNLTENRGEEVLLYAQWVKINCAITLKDNYVGPKINGATWTNTGLSFDGVDDWVNLGIQNHKYQTMEATFSTQDSSIGQCIIGNWESGGGGIYISSGYLRAELYINGAYHTLITDVIPSNNTKYHVALTYDGQTIKLYINGVLNKSESVSGTIGVPYSNTVMALGANPVADSSANGSFLKGKIYSARLYNRALSEDEVKQNQKSTDDYSIVYDGLIKNIDVNHQEVDQVTVIRKYGKTLEPLFTPERQGYIFGGWFTDVNDGIEVEDSTNVPKKDTIYYAHWGQQRLTINPNGGTYRGKTENSTIQVQNGQDINLGVPTRPGYTFVRWIGMDGEITDKNLLNGAESPELKSPSTNLEGYWRSASSGGTRKIINITNPPAEGITKGFELPGQGNAQDVAQDSIPVTAGKEYTISVWAKGTGTLRLQLAGKDPWTSKSFTLNNVTNWTKYSFTLTAGSASGQATINNGTVNAYFGNTGATGTTLQICGMKLEEGKGFSSQLWDKFTSTELGLTAEWKQNTTLTINPNGGTWNGTTANTTINQRENSTYSIVNNPTRAGYVFNGWTLSEGGNYSYFDTSSTATETKTINYTSASSALPTAYNNKGNGTVTRSMVADSTATGGYSLKVVTNGEATPGAGGIYLPVFPTTAGRINVLEIKAKIPTGYNIELAGISYEYTGISSAYKSNDRAGNGEWKTYYLVVYMGDTGTFGANAYINLNGSNNKSVTWYVNSIVMRSYTKAQFKSLYTFKNTGGTLTANWQIGGSRVTFNPNGGSFNTTYVKNWTNGYNGASASSAYRYYYNGTAYGTHPGNTNYNWTPDTRVISKTGYTFAGWYTAVSGGTKIFNADGTLVASIGGYSDASKKWTKYDANVTLYARWTANTYKVSFNANGGSGGQSAQVTATYGSAMPAISKTAPTRTGYTFGGWYDTSAASGGTQYYTAAGASARAYNKTAAATLYARWTERTATLSYNANGHGTAPSAVTMRYSAATKAAGALSATNYIFIRWNTAANGSGTSYNAGAQVKAANVIPSAKTLYAQWQAANYWVSSPSVGTMTLADAVNKANSGATITVLKDVSDASAPTIAKNVTINLNGKTLNKTRNGINITAGTTTIKGSGYLNRDNTNSSGSGGAYGILLNCSSTGNLSVVNANLKGYGSIINYQSSAKGTLSVNNSGIRSYAKETIYISNSGNVTITNSTVASDVKNCAALTVSGTKKTITINGDSIIGNAYNNTKSSVSYNTVEEADSPIHILNGSTLNLGGSSKVLAGPYGNCGVVLHGGSNINVNDSASIYSFVWKCIAFAGTTKSTVKVNTTGYLYTGEHYTIYAESPKSESVTLTKGHFVSTGNKYMVCISGNKSYPGGSSTSTRQFYKITGFNATTGKATIGLQGVANCYYLAKGV